MGGNRRMYSMAISHAELLSPYFTFNGRMGQYSPINLSPTGTGWGFIFLAHANCEYYSGKKD